MDDLPFNRDADLRYSRTIVDFDVAEVYAKSDCKECYGKGVVKYHTGLHGTTIRNNKPIAERTFYCECTRQNARKYG